MYTADMKRTQVYLEESEWRRLQEKAAARGASAASLVREAVMQYLVRSNDVEDDDPIMRFVREMEAMTPPGPPTDGALNHDHYLYGAPKVDEE